LTKLDDIISILILNLFQNVKDSPSDALIEQRYQSELAIATSKLKTAQAKYKRLSSDLKTYQDEVLKAIQETSSFDPKILNDLIAQTSQKLDTSQSEVARHKQELENKQNHVTTIQSQYHNILSWADIFIDSDIEVKKMIAGYLIESVKVSRGYEIDIKFNVAYEHFAQNTNGGDIFCIS